MAKNDFKPFASGENANVLTQAEYEALEAVGSGFQSGIARSEQLNKVWRQSSAVAATLGSFIADKSGDDVLDDGDLKKLQTSLIKALLNNSTSQLDGRYLNVAKNLSDLSDATKARQSLGLKGAAIQDVGTTTGTVAAGNDSRIVNALQRGSNLGDLTKPADARKNLELGTAATANVQTSTDDLTTGRLLVNGNAIAYRTTRFNAGTDFNSAPTNSTSFVYGAATNSPGITGSVLDFTGLNGGYNVQICADYGSAANRMKFRTRNGDNKTWNPWYELYHTGHKPTAGDVGALPSGGGTLAGQVNLPTTGNGAYDNQYGSGAPLMQTAAKNETSSTYWPITKQRITITGTNQYAYAVSTGTLTSSTQQPSWQVHIKGSAGQSYLLSFSVESGGRLTVPGQMIPGNYGNFDNRYQAKGSYTPAGQAYTKAESDSRYVRDIRQSSTVYLDASENSGKKLTPNGAVFIGSQVNGKWDNNEGFYYSYIQKNINGTWYTISRV